MTEIPEHLLKRSKSAKAKKAAAPAGEAASTEDTSKIPRALLERSRAAKAKAGGGDSGGGAPSGGGAAPVPAGPSGGGVATLAPPVALGPDGHTQRLLTVVKSGSIQDIKSKPVDKVHTWPHLLAAEFTAALFILAFTLIFSIFINAPLLTLADANNTPNPAKAPWYFLGLQELLTMFDPMIAGVTLPGVVLVVLGMAPFVDKNPSNKPEDRKFMISLMTVHLMFWAVLTLIGSFFRGPGFNFTYPWDTGLTGIFHL